MKKLLTRPLLPAALLATTVGGILAWSGQHNTLEASSHREAPLIADDPLADNTDLYVFRSPDAPANDASATATIIANYIPFELPQGGPNFNSFGENIRYEIHVKNNPATTGDDITYRFTFTRTNQAPTTFFRVRLGLENLKTTYLLEQSLAGGAFTTLVTAGQVPAPNIGPRSITSTPAGLGRSSYQAYLESTIQSVATTGGNMQVYCGPSDDAFFTDLGAIFDLGAVRSPSGARDGLARKNVHSIVMKIPVAALVRTGAPALTASTNPLAGTTSPASPVSPYTVGVWASASRLSVSTITADGTRGQSGTYVQVSRLGMPLTNEVVQPVGMKDAWNNDTPYGVATPAAGSRQAMFEANFKNPELGLYMADNVPVNGAAPKPTGQTYYGEAIQGPVGPTRGLGLLRIQSKSLAGLLPAPLAGGFDFRNGAPGLAPIFGNALTNGTALAPVAQGGFGEVLLNGGVSGAPRSVDLLPIFHTGVPNLPPYQLATGKTGGNPLSAGKPFINNFLPTFGDMLRINLAVQPTSRTSADFSSEGLLAAAVLGLTDVRYTASGANYIAIPNMDGFPNGRRLEDDVTRIELQAVGGVVLAAIGLWYDDYTVGTSPSPVTAQLGNVLGFSTNVERNDTTFRTAFPFVQTPWSGTTAQRVALAQRTAGLGLSPNLTVAQAYPNPFLDRTTLHFELPAKGTMSLLITDVTGRRVATVAKDRNFGQGVNELTWQPGRDVAPGQYIATLYSGKTVVQSVRIERQ